MERGFSSQTGKTTCWSHNSWLEERARNLLVVVRSGRGEKLPARLDKTVLEIPVESKLSPLPTFPNKGSDLFSLFVLCECHLVLQSTHRGHSNKSGECNCFLNGGLQILWHNQIFPQVSLHSPSTTMFARLPLPHPLPSRLLQKEEEERRQK